VRRVECIISGYTQDYEIKDSFVSVIFVSHTRGNHEGSLRCVSICKELSILVIIHDNKLVCCYVTDNICLFTDLIASREELRGKRRMSDDLAAKYNLRPRRAPSPSLLRNWDPSDVRMQPPPPHKECIILDYVDSDEEDLKLKQDVHYGADGGGGVLMQEEVLTLYEDDDEIEFLGIGGNKDEDIDIMAIIKPKTLVEMENTEEEPLADSNATQPVVPTKPVPSNNSPSDSPDLGK
jgi:hypothetical protein